jgi:hypothetical protein
MAIAIRNSPLLVASSTLLLILSGFACGPAPEGNAARAPRTITVAQSGDADVVGADNVALQKAADLLQAGDTLAIGEGAYTMENGLYFRSNVTVRGVAGKAILLKNAGVRARSTTTAPSFSTASATSRCGIASPATTTATAFRSRLPKASRS